MGIIAPPKGGGGGGLTEEEVKALLEAEGLKPLILQAKLKPESVSEEKLAIAVRELLLGNERVTAAMLKAEAVTEEKLALAVREKLVKELEWKEIEELNAKLEMPGLGWPGHLQVAIDKFGYTRFRGSLKAKEETGAGVQLFKIPLESRPESNRRMAAASSIAASNQQVLIEADGKVTAINKLAIAAILSFDNDNFSIKNA